MIEKIEELYIEKMSILEKHRGKISITLLTLGLSIGIVSILKWSSVLWFLITVLIVGIAICIGIRIYDFIKTIIERPKVKLIYTLREYEKSKFIEIKGAIKKILKKEKSYNLQTIQTLIDKYSIKYENKKDTSIENYKWLVTIVVSLIALTTQKQVEMATIIILFVCILVVLKKVFDIAFDYLLTNKINYNLIYDILVEIKLDIINKKENEKIVRNNQEKKFVASNSYKKYDGSKRKQHRHSSHN